MRACVLKRLFLCARAFFSFDFCADAARIEADGQNARGIFEREKEKKKKKKKKKKKSFRREDAEI